MQYEAEFTVNSRPSCPPPASPSPSSPSPQDPKDDISVVARSDTDVQIVRYIPLSLFNTFHQVKRMIGGIGNMLFSTYSQTLRG